mgnify:CR=1 FL=1
MDGWLENVIRQIILYSLPVLISLTIVSLAESKLTGKDTHHPFHAVSWAGTWLPWLASILFGRGMIIALSKPVEGGVKSTAYRFFSHLLLCGLGFMLYSWSLSHQPPTGLPPLHHWWAKVLMFFNLCMACMHLLPLPGQITGELLLDCRWVSAAHRHSIKQHPALIHAIMAATPLLDGSIGAIMVFPVYEHLANLA